MLCLNTESKDPADICAQFTLSLFGEFLVYPIATVSQIHRISQTTMENGKLTTKSFQLLNFENKSIRRVSHNRRQDVPFQYWLIWVYKRNIFTHHFFFHGLGSQAIFRNKIIASPTEGRGFKSHLGLGFFPSLRTFQYFIISCCCLISVSVYSLRRVVGRISICFNVTAWWR